MLKLIILSTFGLWLAFAVIFPVATWARRQPKWVQYPIYPLVAAFFLLDVIYNAVIGSMVFLELPRAWTFSERIERIRSRIKNPLPGRWYGWRYHVAGFFEKIILSVDPNHF